MPRTAGSGSAGAVEPGVATGQRRRGRRQVGHQVGQLASRCGRSRPARSARRARRPSAARPPRARAGARRSPPARRPTPAVRAPLHGSTPRPARGMIAPGATKRRGPGHGRHGDAVQLVRGGVRSAPLGGARALQHRPGRVRQASARQARDDPRALRRRRARGALGRDPGAEQPLRQPPALPRGGEGRSRGDAAAADAGDGRRVLRHVEVRRDPALHVGAVRRRRDPPPGAGLPGQGAGHGPRQRRAHPRGHGRARRAARRRGVAGRMRRRLRGRGHAGRRPRAALLLLRHDGAREGHPPRAPLRPRPRGVRLLPRRAGGRALPRHGGVGVGGGHRAAARPVATRCRPARLSAGGRLRPAQAARRALPPRRHQRVHDADGDALHDGHRRTPGPATRSSSGSCAARASR